VIKVFVYGTLRKGEYNARFMKDAKLLDDHCWTYGVLYDTGEGYPAMIVSNQSKVNGELYLVTEKELESLDDLEGYVKGRPNNLYERIERTVYTDRGEETAYLYIANSDRPSLLKKVIPNGDWKEYLRLQIES